MRVVGAYQGTYTILAADRISITEYEFDDIIGSLSMTFVQKNVDSDRDTIDDTVTLEVTRNTISFLEVTGVTGSANQRAAAIVLDSLEEDNPIVQNPIVQAVLA